MIRQVTDAPENNSVFKRKSLNAKIEQESTRRQNLYVGNFKKSEKVMRATIIPVRIMAISASPMRLLLVEDFKSKKGLEKKLR